MNSSREEVTIELFLDDLSSLVRQVDEKVFVRNGHPQGIILTLDEFPKKGIPPDSYLKIASFSPVIPRAYDGAKNIFSLKKSLDCYLLWKEGLVRKLNFLAHDVNCAGMGDRRKQDMLLHTALALVRYRVLMHKEWFPQTSLRTLSTMTRYKNLFGSNEFRELNDLKDIYKNDARRPGIIDAELTICLVIFAHSNGYGLDDALKFLVSS